MPIASSGGLAWVPSGTGGAQSVQTQASGGIAGTGFTTASTAGTALVGTLNTLGLSLGVPAYVTTGGAGGGINVSAAGNTTGTLALVSSGTLVLAGGNNVTLSQSGNSITISANTAAAANLSVSAGTTTGAFGGLTFSNSNGFSFGLNNGTITGSLNTTSGAGLGTSISGNLSITMGTAGIQVNASNLGATGFATTTTNGTAVVGTNNTTGFTLGVPPFITTQTNQTVGLYAVGNTTQNSSTTLDARTLSFNALGAATAGYSNGSIQLSVPATSSISVTGALSISVNASTISIGAPQYGTLSYWDNGILNGIPVTTALGLGSVIVQQIVLDANLSISALREFISGSFSVTNSSYGNTISIQAGIYTRNGSTLSLASSGSQSYAMTNTSNNSASIYTGIKGITLPLNASMTPGNYWLALWSSTASSGFNFATFNNVVASEGALTYNGILGSSAAGTNQVIFGGGIWSTTSANLPASIGISHISGTIGNIAPFVNIYNVSA